MVVSEIMNAKVAGIPAFLSVKKSPSGSAMTVLEWATDKKQYTVTLMDDVTEKQGSVHDRKWLLKLANSIAIRSQ